MTHWEQLGIRQKVVTVLESVQRPDGTPHHFGWPYMTAYQLAIKINQRYPEVARTLDMQVGGRGIGPNRSLSQYLAGELSRGIERDGDAYPVEGAFLTNENIADLAFNDLGRPDIHSSLMGNSVSLSMFRRRRPNE